MGSVGGVPAGQAVSREIRDYSGKQYEPINIVDRTNQAGITAISSGHSVSSTPLLRKVTNPELCLNKASNICAKSIAKWSCESAKGQKGKIQSAFKWLFERLGIIKTIHREGSRKKTPIKWGGQVFNYQKKEDYSIEGVSGKKITLESEDTSESLTFNTAVDSFYRVGDYVVINRRECEENPRPDEPDGRTSILGIDKFKEILTNAGRPTVTYELDTDMAGVYGPKEVMEQIGPQIFQERGFFLINAIDIGLPMGEVTYRPGAMFATEPRDLRDPQKKAMENIAGLVKKKPKIMGLVGRNKSNSFADYDAHYDSEEVVILCCRKLEESPLSPPPPTEYAICNEKRVYSEKVDEEERRYTGKFDPDVSIVLKEGDIFFIQNKSGETEGGLPLVRGHHRVLGGWFNIRNLSLIMFR